MSFFINGKPICSFTFCVSPPTDSPGKRFSDVKGTQYYQLQVL